jgi:DNA-directed RNA polymerase specialized sigma24 family protein
MQPAGGTPEPRFHTLYENCYQAIYACVLRRTTAGHDDVPDIVAEVFVVAWRRRHVIPEPPEDRLWLYGVARRVLHDHERRVSRRRRLEARLWEQASAGPAVRSPRPWWAPTRPRADTFGRNRAVPGAPVSSLAGRWMTRVARPVAGS